MVHIQKFKVTANENIKMLESEEQRHAEKVKELSNKILATEGGAHSKKGKRPLGGDAAIMNPTSMR